MKKILAMLLCMSVVLSVLQTLPAFAAEDSTVLVRLDGTKQNYDVEAQIIEGRTMVPMRGIFTALGAEVAWDGEQQHITATKGAKVVELTIGDDKATVNGEIKTLDVSPIIYEGSTLVPLRFISEALDCYVEWDAERREACIWTPSREVIESLRKYDEIFTDKMLDWMVSLYDPESGGFYDDVTSLKPYNTSALLEPTAQQIDFMVGTRLIGRENGVYDLSTIPEELRLKFIEFFQSRQSEEDGYFYDPVQGKNVADSRRERNFTKSVTALTQLGAKPLYKTPTERLAEEQQAAASGQQVSSSLPEHYQSEEKFMAWVKALPWHDPYEAGNTLASSITMIRATGFQKPMQEFVASMQNPETGFWGGAERNYETLNAAMKISAIYDKDYPFPHLEECLNSIIYVLENCEPPTASAIWNVLSLFNTAKNSHEATPEVQKLIDDNFVKMNEIILEKIKIFLREDGGYAYSGTDESTTSTINGNLLCTSYMREQAYWVYKLLLPPVLDVKRDSFFEALMNKEPIEKEPFSPYLSKIDFTDDKIDSRPSVASVSDNTKTGATIKVIEDPYNFRNKCYQMSADNTGYITSTLKVGSTAEYKSITFSQRVMIYEVGTPKAQWYVNFGGAGQSDVALCLLIDCEAGTGNSALLKARNADMTGAQIDNIGYMTIGDWHKLDIVYEPKGLKDTKISYYLDGILLKESNLYFNDGEPSKMPTTVVGDITIGKFSYTGGNFLWDDFVITYEPVDAVSDEAGDSADDIQSQAMADEMSQTNIEE